MQVSIIIVNYNTLHITKDCIASIFNYTKDIDFEIVLVDNASTDGSKQFFENRSSITYIYSNENLGFGKANNLGAEIAKGEFLFMLNSDTVLMENSIEKLYSFFIRYEHQLNLGVLGCLMLDENKNINGYGNVFPNIKSFNRENIRTLPGLGRLFKISEIFYDIDKEFFPIDYVLGADMFLRKSLFCKVSGFDPKYFMYFEESDLQLRIARLNFKNYIYTGTKIFHFEGGSFGGAKKVSNNKRIMVHNSKVYYAKKNFPTQYFIFKILDIGRLFLNIINYKYSFAENKKYISEILKNY